VAVKMREAKNAAWMQRKAAERTRRGWVMRGAPGNRSELSRVREFYCNWMNAGGRV
jgi:hypothetical protein